MSSIQAFEGRTQNSAQSKKGAGNKRERGWQGDPWTVEEECCEQKRQARERVIKNQHYKLEIVARTQVSRGNKVCKYARNSQSG